MKKMTQLQSSYRQVHHTNLFTTHHNHSLKRYNNSSSSTLVPASCNVPPLVRFICLHRPTSLASYTCYFKAISLFFLCGQSSNKSLSFTHLLQIQRAWSSRVTCNILLNVFMSWLCPTILKMTSPQRILQTSLTNNLDQIFWQLVQ